MQAQAKSRTLTREEVAHVSGAAISCGRAISIASTYVTHAAVLNAFGASSLASAAAGRAQGLLEGACEK